MTNLGWTAEKQVNTHTNIELNPPPIQRILSGLEWKNEVAKKRHEVLEQRKQRMSASHKHDPKQSFELSSSNIVKIADKSYLTKKIHKSDTQQALNTIVEEFSLNTEQEKAFCIVATHASDLYSEPLRMYIGGMAGTGKSQVLKALKSFFKKRNESHRFIVVAPTGSAAALLEVVFKGPVYRTGKKTETGLNWTD